MPQNNFFFLHIKKAGGQSFRNTFSPPYVITEKKNHPNTFIGLPKEEWNDVLNNYKIPLGEYDYKRMLFAKKFLFTTEEFDTLYKFVIVRNPYDRAVSFWKYIFRMPRKLDNVPNPKRFYMQHSFEFFLKNVEWLWTRKWDRHMATHTAPIWGDITDENGKLLVDEIYKLEEIEENLAHLNQKLGTDIKTYIHRNKSVSKEKDYRKYYNKKTRALVEKIYADDIANLGYEF